MLNKRPIIHVFIAISIIGISTGCSFTEIDTSLQEGIRNLTEGEEEEEVYVTPDGTTIAPEDVAPQPKPVAEEQKVYIGFGEPVSDYVIRTDMSGETWEQGIQGLEYTMNGIEIFDSLYESPIKPEELPYGSEEMFQANGFILVEMEASYMAPEGGADEITVALSSSFTGYYDEEKGNADFGERMGALPENHSIEPLVIYCSEHLPIDDPEFSKIYSRTTMKSGEKKTYKIGIIVAKEFIESENIYMEVSTVHPDSGDNIHTFLDLFADKINEENLS